MKYPRRESTIGTLILLLGCTRTISDSGSGSGSASAGESSPATSSEGPSSASTQPSSQDDGSQSSSSTTGDDTSTTALPPIVCEDGYTPCDGECVLLGGDPANCGECGHACKGWGTTERCSNWECEPGVWPCIKPDQGITTCNEACASVGQACATDAYCSDYVRVWLTVSANDNNPEATIESCELLVAGSTSFTQSCDTPIDWNFELAGRTVLGIACCCTQD